MVTRLTDSKADMAMPFPPPSRSRSTSAGSSEANQPEDELRESTRPSSFVYPSLLDTNLKGFQESRDERGVRSKSSSGVLGLPEMHPLASQLNSIRAPPGLEHLEHIELNTEQLASPLDPLDLPNCPGSIVEPPPGLQNGYSDYPMQIGPVDCGAGCKIFIPPVHSFVPPPPAHSPKLPATISEPEPDAFMSAPVAPVVRASSLFASIGSLNHGVGACKPCAFVHTKGCQSGVDCTFCHLCPPGEKKRRSKITKQMAKCQSVLEGGASLC